MLSHRNYLSHPTMNQSDLAALNNASLKTLTTQAPNHLLWLIMSPISIVTNLLVVITITSTKSLHNKSQYAILSYSVAEVVYGFVYFGTGLKRYLSFALGYPETANQLWCIAQQIPLTATGRGVQLFSLAVAVDRFLCLAAPIFYKTRNPSTYIAAMNVIIWGHVCILACLAFAKYDTTKLFPVCSHATSFDRVFVTLNIDEGNFLTALTAATYVFSAAILFRRYKSATLAGEQQKRDWKRQMEFDVFLTVSVIGVFYLSTAGITNIISAIATMIGTLEATVMLSPVASAFVFLGSTSHLFVYLKMNRVFRHSFMRAVLKPADNTVLPLTIRPSLGIL